MIDEIKTKTIDNCLHALVIILFIYVYFAWMFLFKLNKYLLACSTEKEMNNDKTADAESDDVSWRYSNNRRKRNY